MNPEQVAQDIIHRHQDALVAVAETQGAAIAAAAQRMVRCLLEDGRLICCGSGTSALLAELLAARLLGRLERDRPGLPAIILQDNGAGSGPTDETGTGESLARSIRAVGRDGDLLVVLCSQAQAPGLVRGLVAARDRGIPAVALTGQDGGDIATALGENDLEVRVPVTSPVRVEEVHHLIVNLLCELVERELFGDPQ